LATEVWLFALVLLLTCALLLLVLFALLLLELGSGSSPHAINPIMTRLEAQTRHASKFVDFIIARSEGRDSKPFA
jgi:hypothetical protein